MNWIIFPWKKRAHLYLHFPCFDGIISGVLTVLFLEKMRKWRFKKIQPVNYSRQKEWLDTVLPRHSAVVDFLYHPQAEFWADHHPTTFLTEQARADFEARKDSFRLYDRKSGSCASLLWIRMGDSLGPDPRLDEMARWAEKIDSAAYESVEEALSNSHPALILNRSLAIHVDQPYCKYLVKKLSKESLGEVAETGEVQRRFKEAEKLSKIGMERVAATVCMKGNVVVFEANAEGALINRYLPYHFFPEALYSIGITHSERSTVVSAMRNPWRDFESAQLGEFMRQFGGGGHQRIGTVVLGKESKAQAHDIVEQLLLRLDGVSAALIHQR